MTNTSEDKPNLALLESTLERYGADRTRWPADMRRQLAGLLGTSKVAQCLVSEATALDHLLDMAPSLSDARGKALADRIVSAAKTMPWRSRRQPQNAKLLVQAAAKIGPQVQLWQRRWSWDCMPVATSR